MECRFSVEAKTFSFSVISGKAVLRLEEKRKRFGGFILLGGKGSVWLADKVEEAIGDPKKGEFASSFSDEVRVLKLRMGSNRAGWFLEAAVFVEGNRKGVIRLPEGRGGWGWRRFVEELRPMSALLVAKVPPAVGNADVGGKPPSYAEVLAAPLGGLKPACGEDLASVLGRWFSSGCMSCLTEMTELLRSQATEFLARMRAEVDRILFFGLGLKTIASRAVRKKLGRALSRLGLKHKLTLGWRKSKSKACGLVLRPKSLVVNTRAKPDDRVQVNSGQGQASSLKMLSPMGKGKGETSPEKTPVAQESTASFDVGSVQMGCSELVPEMGLTSTEGDEESPVPMVSTQIVPETILTATEAAAIPEKTSPEISLVSSSMEMPVVTQIPMDHTQLVLLAPELAQTAPVLVLPELPGTVEVSEGSVSPATVLPVPKAQLSVHGLTVADGSDEISVLPTSSSTNSASPPSPVSSPTSPVSPSPEPSGPIEAHDLPIPEPVMVVEAPNSPENTQTQDSGGGCRGSLCNAPSSKLAPTDPVGSSFSPEHSGLVDVSEGSESALVFPEAQLMVNGLTEIQAWYIGWLRDSTQNHNLLAFIDCMEEQTRRKNEVVPPPLVCSTELSKLKAMFKAEIRDENRETVVQNLALAAAAEAGFTVGPRG
jgi:hypothetical protein